MKRRILLLASLALLNYNFSIAQQNLNNAFVENLDSILSKTIDQDDLSGIAISIQSSDYKFNYSFGYTDISNNEEIQPGMLFGIACITKPFISTIVLQLIEEEKFTLNDFIYQVLDSVPANIDSCITVKQLLEMRSGLHEYLSFDFMTSLNNNPSHFWNYNEILSLMWSEHSPGYFQYGTPDYILLGKIIEESTGNTIENELRYRFFDPISMNSTFFSPQETPVGNWATPFDATQNPVIEINPDSLTAAHSALWSAGGMVSTPPDITEWFYQLFNNDLISDTMLAKMTNFGTETPYWANGYGMGLAKFSLGSLEFWGHLGGWPGHKVYAVYEPVNKMAITIATNQWTFDETLVSAIHPVAEAFISLITNSEMENFYNVSNFKIYPNPASNTIKVELPMEINECQIIIVNMLGKTELKATMGKGSKEIDISNLAKGFHMVNFHLDETVVSRKLIVN